jgi:hypothetical protein
MASYGQKFDHSLRWYSQRVVDLNQDTTAARRNGPAEAGPTKTHHNRRTPATKKHAVRVLGRYGNKRGGIPGTGFCQCKRNTRSRCGWGQWIKVL